MDKLYNGISLSRKAGKLCSGFNAAIENIEANGGGLVMFTQDYSEKSRAKALARLGKIEGVEYMDIPYTQNRIAAIAGRETGILSISDKGFINLCLLNKAREK